MWCTSALHSANPSSSVDGVEFWLLFSSVLPHMQWVMPGCSLHHFLTWIQRVILDMSESHCCPVPFVWLSLQAAFACSLCLCAGQRVPSSTVRQQSSPAVPAYTALCPQRTTACLPNAVVALQENQWLEVARSNIPSALN